MNTDKLKWRQAVNGESICSNEVHVWRLFLDLTTHQCGNLTEILSNDELVRAGRFRFERDQKRFIAGRGILRKILGCYLGVNPQKLRFDYTPHGKPILATNAGYDTLRFNLSHSGAFALYAVTRGGNIGIDIEHVRNDIDVEQISQRYFSPGEISSLDQTHKKKRSGVFFQYWTRKEAFLKATGEGLSFPMEQCDVSLISKRRLSPIALLGSTEENLFWYGQDLIPGYGYAAAIAVEGGDWDVSCWHYTI